MMMRKKGCGTLAALLVLCLLLSACGDLQICQVVDPLMTARMCMPKFILRQIGFEF